MSPSGADIDIVFNPTSMIENFRKVDKARQDMEKGVVGAAEIFTKEYDNFSQKMTTATTRWGKQQESIVRSVEKMAASYGSAQNKIDAMQAASIKRLKGNEEAIKAVTAAYDQMRQAQKLQADQAKEAETQALVRQSKMAGLSKVGQLQFRQGEVATSGESVETIKSRTAALQGLIEVENRQIAKEREAMTASMERQAATAGMSKIEQMEYRLTEIRAEGVDVERRSATVEKQIAQERQQNAQNVEKAVQSAERQALMAGKARSEQMKIQLDLELKEQKALGATEEQIKRLTAARQKQIGVEEEEERKRGERGGVGNLLFRGARDIFEGRMAYGTMDIFRAGRQMMGGAEAAAGAGEGAAAGAGGLLAGVAGTAVVASAGLTLGLGAMAVAGYKAAEAIGEVGRSIRETQLVTGMSARDVQLFGAAAKMTGLDVSILERMMRGLTQAVTDEGTAGEKGRAALQRMGVDTWGLRTGAIGVSEAFDQMSESISRQPDVFQKDADLMAVFKRAGIESAGVMTELLDAKKRLGGAPFLTEDDVKRASDFNKELVTMKTTLGLLWEKAELFAGGKFIDTYMTAKAASNTPFWKMAGALATGGTAGLAGALTETVVGEQQRSAPGGTKMSARRQGAELAERQMFERALARQEGDNLDAAEEKLKELKKDYDDIRKNVKAFHEDHEKYYADVTKAAAAVERQDTAVKSMKATQEAQLSLAQKLANVQETVAERKVNPFMLPAEAELTKFNAWLEEQRAKGVRFGPAEEAQIGKIRGGYIEDTGRQALEQARKFQRQMSETQEGITREQFRARLGYLQPVDVRGLGGPEGTTRADIESDINERYQQRVGIAHVIRTEEEKLINTRQIDAKDAASLAQQQRDLEKVAGDEKTARVVADVERYQDMYKLTKEERDQEAKHRIEISRIQLADQEDAVKYEAQLEERRAQLRFKGDSPAAGIRESQRIALDAAQKQYDIRIAQIDLEEVGWEKERDHALALRDLDKERYRAQEEANLKLAEMQQQQVETLKGKIEPLYQTLFTNPSKFGQQLRSTVTEAALHPIVSGMSELTAQALHPLIYGATGTGGIAGAFGDIFGGGGKPDGSKLKPLYVIASSDGQTSRFGSADRSDDEGGGGGPASTAEAALLGQIRGRESGGDYAAQSRESTASGAYQFTQGTWRMAAAATGVGGEYRSAREAPQSVQDQNALWLLRQYGPNSTTSWAASGPYGQGGGAGVGEAPRYNEAGMPVFSTTAYGYADGTGGYSPVPGGGGGAFAGGGYGYSPMGGYSGGGVGGNAPSSLARAFGAVFGPRGTATAADAGYRWFPGTKVSGFDIDPSGFDFGPTSTYEPQLMGSRRGSTSQTGTGGGAFNLKSLTGLLGGFKQSFGIGPKPAVFGETPGGESLGRVGASGMGGTTFSSVATSPMAKAGAGMVGMMLAQQGLLGQNRGTVGGMFEGMAGGAGIGFQYGGPLGAAIGAAAGLGIGAGEMIAGVESPRNEAKRLVQSTYHIGINNTTADQIVSIANQSYAGRVSIAVRSPEVRHMLGLYAAGTGQAGMFQQGLGEAHGASLVESGGSLMQQSTFQYGNAYAYQSNLPVYGGQPTHMLGGPGGGNVNLALSIGGQDAARFLQGNVVSPDVVQTQYASAMQGSTGRVAQSLLMSEPGSIAS